MSGVSEFDNVFIMGDETPCCSKCGARTEIVAEYTQTRPYCQLHRCLSCFFEFVLIDDDD